MLETIDLKWNIQDNRNNICSFGDHICGEDESSMFASFWVNFAALQQVLERSCILFYQFDPIF